MQGVILLEFLDMATTQFGPRVVERSVELADAESGGDYDEGESYDPGELTRLVGSVARQSGRTPKDLMQAFGRHLFTRVLAASAPLAGASNAREFWSRVSSMAPETPRTRGQARDADLPAFQRSDVAGTLHVDFRVSTPLADMAEGFVAAAGDRFPGTAHEKPASTDARFVCGRIVVG